MRRLALLALLVPERQTAKVPVMGTTLAGADRGRRRAGARRAARAAPDDAMMMGMGGMMAPDGMGGMMGQPRTMMWPGWLMLLS
jgi:hypothetical protein